MNFLLFSLRSPDEGCGDVFRLLLSGTRQR